MNEQRLRLLGFQRVQLRPGESRRVTLTADPRLLALGRSAEDFVLTGNAMLAAALFGE